METEIEKLKWLLREVSAVIDPILYRFEGSIENDDVLMPLCEVGMKIDEALLTGTTDQTKS